MTTTRLVSTFSSVFLAGSLTTSLAGAQPAEATPDPTSEMTFGRRAAPAPAPLAHPPGMAIPGPGPVSAPVRVGGRVRTMEEVSEAVTEEMTIRNMRWRYSLNFFGDISLSAIRPVAEGSPFGFSLGAQDLLIRGELSNHITATTEIALEPGDGGVTVDIERFGVRWQSAGYFIEAGRTHTAFGYWNNAYHHGRWLQPTIARPRWVAFEDDGGILPVHWVGAGGGARVPLGGGATLNLQANVGNGRGEIVDDVRNAHDYQAMKAFLVSAEVVGLAVPELRAGFSAVYGKIPAFPRPLLPPPPPETPINEYILGAHVAYVNVPLLFIGEGYWVAHTALGHQFNTYGGFVLIGYAFGRTTPYVELERIASKGVDPFFVRPDRLDLEPASFDSLKGIVGVRYDLTDWTALKLEYRQTREWDFGLTIYEGVLNWSWGF